MSASNSSLPIDLNQDDLVNIAYKLDFSSLYYYCTTNSDINKLCSTEYFWQSYLKQNFQIVQPIPELNFIRTAKKVYEILCDMKSSKLYLSLDAFQTLLIFDVEYIDLRMDEYLNDSQNYPRLINVSTVLLDRTDDSYPDYPQLPKVVPSGNYPDHYPTYNDDELKFIKAVDILIHKSTAYITLKGLIYIPYDIDMLDNIVFNINKNPLNDNNLDLFLEHIYNRFSIEEQLLAIRYFL